MGKGAILGMRRPPRNAGEGRWPSTVKSPPPERADHLSLLSHVLPPPITSDLYCDVVEPDGIADTLHYSVLPRFDNGEAPEGEAIKQIWFDDA